MQRPLLSPTKPPAIFDPTRTYRYSLYLCGVEGAEREGSLRKDGGESGAPSSLSPRTAHLNAIGGPI